MTAKNIKLAKKLSVLAKCDQKMRKSGVWNEKIDAQNTIELKKIVARYGWPDSRLVGKRVVKSAWLLAQHAYHDLEFQKKCLTLMQEKVERGLVDARYVGSILDR